MTDKYRDRYIYFSSWRCLKTTSIQQKQFTYREIKEIAKKVKGGTVAGAKAESGGGYTTIFFHKYTDADAAISKLRKEGYNVSDRQNNPTNFYSKFKITVEKPVEQSLKETTKAGSVGVGGDVEMTYEEKKTDIEKRRNAEYPIIADPINEPNVPIKVIPPDSPCLIVLNEIIDLGLDLDNLPNSVAHVSDIAAAIEELNNKIFKEEGWK